MSWVMATTNERFAHDPLDTTRKTIRVIRLDRSSKDNIIRCVLKHIDVKDDAYTCLSYAWGPETPTYSISVNGKAFEVRHNLWMFLRRAKKQKIKEWLWIDAICIDQKNSAERGHQVRLMGEIYSKAKRVLVYAGEASWKMEFLALITRLPLTKHLYCDWYDSTRPWVFRFSEGFRNLPYWSRLWVVQEILLAKAVDVMLVRTCMDLESLLPYCESEQVSRMLHWYQTFCRRSAPYGTLKNYDISDPVAFHVDVIFDMTSSLLCEQQNDHIYALLGVISNCAFDDIAIDYTRPWPVLMLDVLQALAKSCHGLTTLDQVMLFTHSFRFHPLMLCPKCIKSSYHDLRVLQDQKVKNFLQRSDGQWDLVLLVEEAVSDRSHALKPRVNEPECSACLDSFRYKGYLGASSLSRPLDTVMFVKHIPRR